MLILQNVPRENRVVRGDFVDTKFLNVGMYRKMRVNGGSKEKVTI